MSARQPRLAAILVLINLVILALPLGGIAVLRVYESALIRQTESELIAQGAFIAATYRAAFERLTTNRNPRAKAEFAVGADYGLPVTAPPSPADAGPHRRLRQPVLDLATDPILPKPPELPLAADAPDAIAGAAGRELDAILRGVQHDTLAGMRVTDFRGTVVASTGEDLGASAMQLDEVRRALAGESVSTMRWRGSDKPPPPLDSISRGTRIRVFVSLPIVYHDRVIGAVLLLRTPGNIWQALYGKRRELALGGALMLALVVALAVLTSVTIVRPIAALREQARRAAAGEQGAVAPLARPGTREIAELSDSVATMAQTLEARARYIRDFAAQVSHEFKTPLAAIQGSVELLRDHAGTMSREERLRFLGILENDARRLERLVRRLLELARADVMVAGNETCDAAAVARDAVERHRSHELGIELQAPASALAAAIPAEVLDAVLSNLLDNVRTHGGASACATVECRGDGRTVELTVADDGAGISAANAARVFDPFFTTARGRGGTGLGLSIARSLLRAHRGDLALLPSERGARFRITVPAVNAA